MKVVFTFIYVHAWETNTYARVNLLEMSTYKSCWRWPVSQFSTFMSLLRHAWLPEEQIFKFPDWQVACEQANWQVNVHFPWPNELTICPDINVFHIPLKTSCTGHRWRKAKDFVVFCSGKSAWYCFKAVVLLFYVICVRYPSITWIYRECKAQNGLIL